MNELKVGLLAIATIVAVVVMSLKITSNQSGFGQYQTYKTIVNDASGIFPKTPIKVAGISAGRIKSIELQGNQALITFEILTQIKVPKNSKIRIKSVGFLGDKYIEIYVGNSTELLANNDFIDSEEAAGIENLVKDTSEVLQDVKVIVKTLKESMNPPGQEPPMKRILADSAELINNVKEATKSLQRIMGHNEAKLNAIVDNLEAFSDQLAYETDRGNKDSSVAEMKQILANVNKMTQDLQGIVADVKKGKGTIGKMLVEDEIADQVKDTLSSVQKILGKANQLRTELSVFAGANTVSGSETALGLRLYPSPERFYDLGIVSAEVGPDKETQTVTTTNGTTTTENKTINDKNTYRFNAQIGRRVQDFAFRGGFIESSGAVGVDYNIPLIGTKVSLEAFDYKKNKGPNLRLSTEAQIYNVFYGKASFNDAIRKSGRSATFSAGLRFNHEDLKGLLGFFF